MDELGKRIIKDIADIQHMRSTAMELQQQAAALRYEANEKERLLEWRDKRYLVQK